MTAIGADFVTLERQLFPRRLGDAFAELIHRRWPRDTAKTIARRYDLDPSTAVNAVKGHVSERTITKAIAKDGWALLAPLGEAMTGQTYDAHLQTLVQEAADAHARARARHERTVALEARAGGVQRLLAGPHDRGEG